MTENPLLEALIKAAPMPTGPAAPKGFEPGYRFSPTGNLDSVTMVSDDALDNAEAWDQAARDAGVPLAADQTMQLVEVRMGHNPKSWQRDAADRREKDTAYTAANTIWHYKFKVVAKSIWRDLDYDTIVAQIRKTIRSKGITPKSDKTTEVVILGDFQAGKTDYLGGTPELIARSEAALAQVLRKIRRTKPAEIVLIDVGDSTEGFQSAPNAAQTNDLDQTEQIRIWRRLLWTWIEALAKFGVPLKVLGVPSNHCRVRAGKAALGKPGDDWGIEAIAQVADMAAVNPAAYGHVEFFVPDVHEEALALTLVGGKTIGAAHGHQAATAAALTTYLNGQAAGRTPIGHAEVVFFGHFHNLQMFSWGDDRWALVSPAMDNGSGYFSNLTGKKSRPGVLTHTMDENGLVPGGMFVAWA